MASLRKRGDYYYIRFSRTIKGKKRQLQFTLGTTSRDEALALKLEYENKYRQGKIDPFNGWTPRKEIEAKRYEYWGKYIFLGDAIENFLAERNHLCENTLKSYRRHLNLLLKHNHSETPVTTISERHIRTFCFRPSLKPATQVTYLRNMRVFFTWLYHKKVLPENPVQNIEAPKIPKTSAKKVITEQELDGLFQIVDQFIEEEMKQPRSGKPNQDLKWFRPMITTIYYSGLRAGEAVNLRWENVNLEQDYIKILNGGSVYTKNRTERSIPIRGPLKTVLKGWNKTEGEPGKGYVFPKPTAFKNQLPMCKMAVSKTFKKFVRLADLAETITLHGLRHSCATDLLRKGMPIHLVSKFLGHAQVSTTQIYEHLNEIDMKEAIQNIE